MKRLFLSLLLVASAATAWAQQPYADRALGRKFSGSVEVGGGTVFELTGRLHTKINDYLTWDLGLAYRFDYDPHNTPALYNMWGYNDARTHGMKLTTGLRAFTPAFARNGAVRAFLAYNVGYGLDRRLRDYIAYDHYSRFGDYELTHHAAMDATVGFEFWHRLTLGYGLGLLSCKAGRSWDIDHTVRLGVCF